MAYVYVVVGKDKNVEKVLAVKNSLKSAQEFITQRKPGIQKVDENTFEIHEKGMLGMDSIISYQVKMFELN